MSKKQTIRLTESKLKQFIVSEVKRVLNEMASETDELDEYGDWKAQMLNTPGGHVSNPKAEAMFGKKYNVQTNQDANPDWKNNFPDRYAQLDKHGGYLGTNGQNGWNTTQVHNRYGVSQIGNGPATQGEYDTHYNAMNDMADYYSGNYKNRLRAKASQLGNAKSGQDFTPQAIKEAVSKALRKYIR